ncbi:hypothetical protein PVT67_17190 [Gallaecimonas kandeliae]|uniref:hypothetical protein n=1 Tax=Gallaecimonas kandeliae TaxID=3029055 RepID=UPI002647135C|nr:hypothetical protein [Gallaecimonas kandeliae]WKE65377.1 hypothetical protein PVT67_17190 [Gallaecimonas kandeliae]
MNLLLKWKIWRIESALKNLVRAEGLKPMVWSFGAYYIDPKYLVFVVGVPTDTAKETLKSNSTFTASMKELLETFNWPIQARPEVVFDVESQETVDRENNGNWWYHYK